MSKICPTCKQTKPLEDFSLSKRSKDGHTGYCRPCSAEKSRIWYKNNQEHCKEVGRKWKEQHPKYWQSYSGEGRGVYPRTNIDGLNIEEYETDEAFGKALSAAQYKRQIKKAREYVRALKQASPCTDCGGFFHFSAMDFDHTGSDKSFNIAEAVGRGVSIRALDREIVKCELVCANCHRVRTWIRLQEVVASVSS
jgi:hypothetical protein